MTPAFCDNLKLTFTCRYGSWKSAESKECRASSKGDGDNRLVPFEGEFGNYQEGDPVCFCFGNRQVDVMKGEKKDGF